MGESSDNACSAFQLGSFSGLDIPGCAMFCFLLFAILNVKTRNLKIKTEFEGTGPP
jgi:hypothetical protein